MHQIIALGLSISLALVGVTPVAAQWVASGANIHNTNSGKVGIGTTAPAFKLHVMDDVLIESQFGAELNLLNKTGGTQWQVVSGFAGGLEFGNVTAGLTDGDAPLFIHRAGRVGVGTTSPAQHLDVRGNFQVGPDNGFAKIWANPTSTNFVIRQTGFKPMILDFGDHLRIRRFGDGSNIVEMVRITSGGNVGIGITNPTEKLEVNGTIKAKEIKVTRSGFPDYVFDDGYDLRPLDEVRSFIDSEGHLPGIPSAEEVEKQGLGVGELQVKLLEKVEELTLYVLELEQRNDQLAQRLDRLDKTAEVAR